MTWAGSDGVGRAVALLLLAMSVASWVVILWKSRLLYRASRDVAHGLATFWQAANWAEGQLQLQALDREGIASALVAAAQLPEPTSPPQALGQSGDRTQQLTRRLRQALQASLHKLQFGQVLLATVGTTAPFIGLLGTVWGIHLALDTIAASGQVGIDQVAGPVGEALVMTAAGLAVAIPAVLAYNVFGRVVGRIEAELEGLAQDLLTLLAPQAAAAAAGGADVANTAHQGVA